MWSSLNNKPIIILFKGFSILNFNLSILVNLFLILGDVVLFLLHIKFIEVI